MIILGIVDIYVVLFVNSFEISNNFRILSINIFLIYNYLASSVIQFSKDAFPLLADVSF